MSNLRLRLFTWSPDADKRTVSRHPSSADFTPPPPPVSVRQTPEYVAQSPALGEVLPYSLVLHLLFARSPPELRSPHHTASWSVSRYSTWLDDHPAERERLQLLTGALDAHVQAVRAQGGTSFADVYPVMLELLKKGMASA